MDGFGHARLAGGIATERQREDILAVNSFSTCLLFCISLSVDSKQMMHKVIIRRYFIFIVSFVPAQRC